MLADMTEFRATSADGTRITALDDGRGPTLLLVHGGGERATSWGGVTRTLTGDFRVVRMDRRIYVPGAVIEPTHSVAVEAADILAVAGALDRPVLLVGHSSGAVAALEAALLAPAAFAGLFLYEPPMPTRSLVGGRAARRARAALAAGDPAEAVRIQLRDIVRMSADVVDALAAAPGGQELLAARAPAQLADVEAVDRLGIGVARFGALDLPTTLLEGDRSPAHLRERVAHLAAVLPNARVLTLAGHGHVAHRTAPAELAQAIREMAERVLVGRAHPHRAGLSS